jgi:hypothetical protein
MTTAEYLESLAQTAGLDDESKAGLKKALGNPKFVEELGKGVKRQEDYSRNMDEARTLKQQTEAQIVQWREWYNTAVTNDAARETELQELRAAKGGVTTASTTTTTPAAGFTRKEIEEREGRTIQIIKQGMKLASRHASKFHEELDTDALERIAVDKGLSLEQAYEEYVRPRVEEASKKDVDEKIRIAREEGLKEGLSKRDLPDDSPKGFHPIFGHEKAVADSGKLTDSQRRSNFEAAWTQETVKK